MLENFFFLGLIAAKALQDGFLLPLPIHQVFFEVALAPHSLDAVAVLSGSNSHMTGCTGELVAQMMSLLPSLRSAQNRKERSSSMGSNSSSSAPSNRKKSDGSSCSSDQDGKGTERDHEPKSLNDIVDATYPFTSGMTLRHMLSTHPMEFSDPITGLAVTPLKEKASLDGLVTPYNLLSYLESIADFWLKSGVSRQVEAFKQGVSQVFDWRHLRSFTAKELSDMVCGAGDIEWSEKSLKKMLQPTSGFNLESPTIKWLISELVSFTQPQRRSFLKFSTALPRLVPGMRLTIACKGVGGSWLPTAQTCTPQLNLAVYASKKDLKAALREAMANADADGGFHERTAGSDGNSNDSRSSRRSEREEREMQVVLPASMREDETIGDVTAGVDSTGATESGDREEDLMLAYDAIMESQRQLQEMDEDDSEEEDEDEDDVPLLEDAVFEDSEHSSEEDDRDDEEAEGEQHLHFHHNEDDEDDEEGDEDDEDDEMPDYAWAMR